MTEEKQSWRDIIQQNGSNKPKQPKLSIPKWVADIFDEFLKDDYDWHDFEMSFVGVDDDDDGLERKFFDWTNSENATELTLAYLNPLTRAFVEVEDE